MCSALAQADLGECKVSALTDKQRGLIIRIKGLTNENAPAAAGALEAFSFVWERV